MQSKLPLMKNAGLVSLAVLALAAPFTAAEEGLRTAAYLDSVNVPTICYGETENVKMGDVKTIAECNAMFNVRIGAFAYAIRMMSEKELPVHTHAALTSWAYNVGLTNAANSTLIKKLRAGDVPGACKELLRWKYAGGKPILAKRREREYDLCMGEKSI